MNNTSYNEGVRWSRVFLSESFSFFIFLFVIKGDECFIIWMMNIAWCSKYNRKKQFPAKTRRRKFSCLALHQRLHFLQFFLHISCRWWLALFNQCCNLCLKSIPKHKRKTSHTQEHKRNILFSLLQHLHRPRRGPCVSACCHCCPHLLHVFWRSNQPQVCSNRIRIQLEAAFCRTHFLHWSWSSRDSGVFFEFETRRRLCRWFWYAGRQHAGRRVWRTMWRDTSADEATVWRWWTKNRWGSRRTNHTKVWLCVFGEKTCWLFRSR